jgi:hypothetical protein
MLEMLQKTSCLRWKDWLWLQHGSLICCIPPWQEKQHGHEQDSFKMHLCDQIFHLIWQKSEYSSQLYIKASIVNIYGYARRMLHAECGCPTENLGKIWWVFCVSRRMENVLKHVHLCGTGWS